MKLILPEEQKQQIEKYFNLCKRLHISVVFTMSRTGTYFAMHFYGDWIEDKDKEKAGITDPDFSGVKVEIEIPYENVPLDEYRICIRIIKDYREPLDEYDEDGDKKCKKSSAFLHYKLWNKEDLLFIREKLLAYYFKQKDEHIQKVIEEMDKALDHEAEVPVLKKYNATITYKVDVKAFNEKGARLAAFEEMHKTYTMAEFEAEVKEVEPKIERIIYYDKATGEKLWAKKVKRGTTQTELERQYPLGQIIKHENKMYKVANTIIRIDAWSMLCKVVEVDSDEAKKEAMDKLTENAKKVVKKHRENLEKANEEKELRTMTNNKIDDDFFY